MKSPALTDKQLVVLFGIFLLLYNNLANLLPPAVHARLYVPMNMLVLYVLYTLLVKYCGLTGGEIGLTTKYLWKNIGYGLAMTGLVVIPFALLIWGLPKIGLETPVIRIEAMDQGSLWRRLILRIPVGTAFFEETLFRGIFFAIALKSWPVRKTTIVSSLLFVGWHIVPALKVAASNFAAENFFYGTAIFILGLAGALAAGLILAWVRVRCRSVIGVAIGHALINDGGLLLIYYFLNR